MERALELIPPELADKITNVAVLIEDDSPPGSPTLLGLYRGIPLTERGASSYGECCPIRSRSIADPSSRSAIATRPSSSRFV